MSDWNYFKSLDVEFIEGDIFDIIDTLLTKLEQNSVLHTSTILNNYIWTNIRHDSVDIQRVRQLIKDKVAASNSIWFETH